MRKQNRSHTIFHLCFFLALSTFSKAHTQTLGGNTAYAFLKLSYSPAQTAAGGIEVSNASDVSHALYNPGLLRAAMQNQVALNFTALPGNSKAYQLCSARYVDKSKTTFGGQILYLNYGRLEATDAAGNELGLFNPRDYVIQVSASKQYLEKWRYGASIKFLHSQYQFYRSSAVAVDVGVAYNDSARQLQVSVVAKNMGAPLKTFAGESEELPFDLEAGITKRLAKAPFAFSLSLQQLHRFNLLYYDTLFNQETGTIVKPTTLNKAIQHFIVATHIFIGSQVEAIIGYNHLHRSELILGTVGNGLTGFSAGLIARFEKLQVSYALSSYQRGINLHQLGLTIQLDKLFGAGRF